MKIFESVADMKAAKLKAGQVVKCKRYYADGDLVDGLEYEIVATATVDGYIDHALSNGNYAILIHNGVLSVLAAGVDNNNTTGDDQALWNATVANNDLPIQEWHVPEGSYRMSVLRLRKQRLICHPESVVKVFNGGTTPSLGQINTGARVYGLNIISEEAELENTRVNIGDDVIWEGGSVQGFTDTSEPTNAWGVYLKDSSNVTLKNIGFDDNTQSDITIVDNCNNITIDGCYGLGSVFHINLEPNTSTAFNTNVRLLNMDMSLLSVLENGSGGTATTNCTVSNCSIGVLKYDGSSVTFQDCEITDYAVGSEIFFGEVNFINTLAIGPNLLEDPYLLNVGFNSSNATANNNAWYVNSTSVSDGIATGVEGNVRYTRLNPSNENGVFNLRPLNPIATGGAKNYLVAVTGRQVSGSSGRYLQVYNTQEDKSCRVFRQSNKGYPFFTTEMSIIPAGVSGDFLVKVGGYSTQTDSVDVVAITVHEILGNGNNVNLMLDHIHKRQGAREVYSSALPVLSNSPDDSFQEGDRVLVGKNTYVYSAAQTFETITQA